LEWALFPDGQLLYRFFAQDWDGLQLYSRAAVASDTILEFTYERLVPKMQGDPRAGTFRATTNPLTALPAWCILTDGRIAWGITDAYRFVLTKPDGTMDRVITRRGSRQAIDGSTATDIHALWARRRAFQEIPEAAGAIELELPDSLPAFASVARGPDSTLWVQRIAEVSAMDPEGLGAMSYERLGSTAWDVFDPEGRYLGVVRFPYPVRLLVSREDRWYAVTRGPYDEDRVVRLRIVKGTRASPDSDAST
jgi:hypothetical protein